MLYTNILGISQHTVETKVLLINEVVHILKKQKVIHSLRKNLKNSLLKAKI